MVEYSDTDITSILNDLSNICNNFDDQYRYKIQNDFDITGIKIHKKYITINNKKGNGSIIANLYISINGSLKNIQYILFSMMGYTLTDNIDNKTFGTCNQAIRIYCDIGKNILINYIPTIIDFIKYMTDPIKSAIE